MKAHTSASAALALAISTLFSASTAGADPVGLVDRNFSQYNGAGPIGNNNLQDNETVYWMYEGSGIWDGKAVDSWFLMWDPAALLTATGTVNFDASILFVLDDRGELIASSVFQKVGVSYDLSDGAVGLEANPDKINTTWSGQTLSFAWTASDPGDHVRVLTAKVPEPGSLGLVMAGLFGVGLGGWSRRQARR